MVVLLSGGNMNFDQAFDKLIGHEGGYVNHKDDKGGATNWGVTESVARSAGYIGDMRDLTLDKAKAIYRTSYWTPIRADQLPAILRYSVFDACVNSGVSQAIKWLQRSLNVVDDGLIGPATLSAANFNDARATLAHFNGHRLEFMAGLPNWPAFGRGWARRVASILKEA